jgi:uncharacterized protein (DUF952 family)
MEAPRRRETAALVNILAPVYSFRVGRRAARPSSPLSGTMPDRIIYKIVSRPLWDAALAAGRFEGSAVDLADGFIHFSTSAQVRETARRHYAGQGDLLLVAVRAEALGPALVHEPSRGGDLFPHLRAPLDIAHVEWVKPLPLGPGGEHDFPPLEPAG